MDLHIKTKFEVGQEVYRIESSRKAIECEKTCDVCLGEGSFIYKNYLCHCPKCGGHGKIVVDRDYIQINSVNDIEWTITSIKVTMDKDGNVDLIYTIYPYTNINNSQYVYGKITALENELFATLEEAQLYCDEQNSIQMGEIVNA